MNSSPINPLLPPGAPSAGSPSWPLINAEVISSQPLTPLQKNHLSQLLAGTQQRTLSALMSATGTATVAAGSATQLPAADSGAEPHLTRLLIANQARWLLTHRPHTPGSQLQLQVTPRGLIPQAAEPQPAPTPRAEVPAPAPSPPGPTPGTPQQIPPKALNALIDRLLANKTQTALNTPQTKQVAISQLLRAAISLAKPAGISAQSLTHSPTISHNPPLARALAHTQVSIPVNAAQVKAAIQQSGLFAEANLRRALDAPDTTPTGAAPFADTKLLLWSLLALTSKAPGSDLLLKLLNLLQLPSEITPEPKQLPQLKAHIQSWLANITRQQLQLLSQTQVDTADNPRLQLELPIKSDPHTLPLLLTIEKHWRRPEDDTPEGNRRRKPERIAEWSFSLTIDIPQQGALDVRLRSDGKQLNCTLWTDQPTLETHINQRLGQLTRAMQDDGIQIGQIRCLAGRMPAGPTPKNTPLLDTHA